MVTHGTIVGTPTNSIAYVAWDPAYGFGTISCQYKECYPYDGCHSGLRVDLNVTIQPTPGDKLANPIDFGSINACQDSRSNTVNTAGGCYFDDFQMALPGTGQWGAGASDVFYHFYLPQTSTVAISTCNSSFDTVLFLFSGSDLALPLGSDDDADNSCSTGSSKIVRVLPAGNYTVVADGFDASSPNKGTLTLGITVSAATPTIVVSPDQELVPGTPTTLTATGAATYTWAPATGLSATSGNQVTANPTQTTTYTVTGTGCSGYASTPQRVTVFVPTDAYNYVTSRTVQTGTLTEETMWTSPPADVIQETTFGDGLGRPMQNVLKQGSPAPYLRDVITPVAYDAFGRTAQSFLPYVQGTDGHFKTNALNTATGQPAFYNTNGQVGTTQNGNLNVAHDATAFAQSVFEASPLNRVEQHGFPGIVWQPKSQSPEAASNHGVKVRACTNTGAGLGSDDVLAWTYTAGATPEIAVGAAYAAGALSVTETTDEHNSKTIEFKDGQGRLVLKKVQAATPSSGTLCASAVDGGSLSIQAPVGLVLTGINSATYGTGSGSCADFAFTCSADVTGMVRDAVAAQLANKVNPVVLAVPNAQIPVNPCVGQAKTLVVTATYASLAEINGAYLETYYVYDDLGLLRAVVQPNGSLAVRTTGASAVDAAFVQNWCFSYRYDARRRVIEKQVPGAGLEQLVYNRRDQLILKTDAVQGSNWQFTKYDIMGRAILTGQYNTGLSRTDLQTQADAVAAQWEELVPNTTNATQYDYTMTRAFPTAISESNLLSRTYYDTYAHATLAAYAFVPENGVTTSQLAGGVTGLVTGHSERVIGGNTYPAQWLHSAVFYDAKYRTIQNQQDLYPSGTERATKAINFAGQPTSSLLTHNFPTNSQAGAAQHTVLQEFTYDHAGRLLETRQQVDNQPKVLLASQQYNQIGQLVDKKLHSTDAGLSFLQSVDYRYNIRGWLSNINDRNLSNNGSAFNGADPNSDLSTEGADLFGMELMYNTNQNLPTSTAQFNGNISEVMWKTNNPAIQGNDLRGYSYHYDVTNRVSSADYRTYGSTGWGLNTKDFSVSGLTYDANGNLRSMNREGRISAPGATMEDWGNLDNLTYNYVGNRLVAVDDAATTVSTHDFHDTTGPYTVGSTAAEYEYDAMGNLTVDHNKKIDQVYYNIINKTEWVELNGYASFIHYVYSAGGTKLQKHTWDSDPNGNYIEHNTDYAGSFLYEDQVLKFAPTPEGRMLYTDKSASRPQFDWKYEYHLRDHLGNLRIAFSDQGGSTTQRTAGMEPANAPQEERDFAHVADTRLRDADHARTGDYVARLDAHTGRRQGPSVRLTVAAGDSVYAEVYGRYDHAAFLATLVQKGALVSGATVAGTPGAVGSDQHLATPARRRWLPFIGASVAVVPQLLDLRRAPVPSAYLRYELFSKDSQLVATRTRPLQRTPTDGWQQLSSGLRADSAGYVVVSLVNESATPAYFDDLQLKTAAAVLMQENNYDPFGLNLVGIESSASGYADSQFQYNGKEKQEDFGLNWTDYGTRMYDAQLGRWHVIDAVAEKTTSWSPYAYVENNPINEIDPNGKWSIKVHYLMTNEAARNLGYDEKTSDILAHYASAWADHPDPNSSVVKHFNEGYLYRDGIDYNYTKASQNDDEHVVWHSMRSTAEAKEGYRAEWAMERGMNFGWNQIFSAAGRDQGTDKMSIAILGQGLHALQDAYAHKGASMSQHLGTNTSSTGLLYNDVYGNHSQADKISQSALLVYGVIKGDKIVTQFIQNSSTTTRFDLSGMQNNQKREFLDKFSKILNGK